MGEQEEQAHRDQEAALQEAKAHQAATNEKIDELIQSNKHVTDTTREMVKASEDQAAAADRFAMAMVEYQEREHKAAFRYRSIIKVVVACFTVLTLVLLAGLIVIVTLVLTNNETASTARDTLLDCVVPGGDCWKRGVESTKAAVNGISDQDLINAVCASHYATLPIPQAIEATRACAATVASR